MSLPTFTNYLQKYEIKFSKNCLFAYLFVYCYIFVHNADVFTPNIL